MKTGRWLLAGLGGGIFYQILMGLFAGLLADRYYDLNPETWRPMLSGWLVKMVGLSLLYGLMVATAYATFARGMSGQLYQRGALLGLVVWLVTVPQYLMEYLTVNVAFPAVFLWIVGSLCGNVLACLFVAYSFGRSLEPAASQA